MQSQPPLEVLEFSKEGFKTFQGPPFNTETSGFSLDGVTLFEQSENGELIALQVGAEILIFTTSGRKVSTITQPEIKMMNFSPNGKYLQTYQYMKKVGDQVNQNFILWDTATGEKINSWILKSITSDNWPCIKWSSDEILASKIVSNEILFYEHGDFSKPSSRLVLADVATVEWAPTVDSYKICAFVPEKKGQPGSFRIYSIPSNQRISMQTCFKAQSGSIIWNKQGTHALLVTQTDMDTTGKSYYGETGVFLMDISGDCKSIRPFLDKEGPIYSYAWSPLGESFVIVFGNMPATTVLFNTKLERLICFPQSHRNTALFSPHGYTLAIAGFGNLQGTIDIWDVKRGRLIDSFQAPCSTSCHWSPCSNYLLTGTLTPRLRQDNGWKVWQTNGTLIKEQPLSVLYNVCWKLTSSSLYPSIPPKNYESSIEKQKEKVIAAAPKKYVPPHARNSSAAASAAPTIVAPVVAVKYTPKSQNQQPQNSGPPSKAANRNKKRREKKKLLTGSGNTGEEGDHESSTSPSGNSPQQPSNDSDQQAENIKKLKNIQKKLRQIDQLKSQQQAGKILNQDQQSKLAEETKLREQLGKLSI